MTLHSKAGTRVRQARHLGHKIMEAHALRVVQVPLHKRWQVVQVPALLPKVNESINNSVTKTGFFKHK